MCIKYTYCTDCTVKQYGDLLDRCNSVVDDDYVLEIATKIMEYSDVLMLRKEYDCSKNDLLEMICFNVFNDCTYTTVKLHDETH